MTVRVYDLVGDIHGHADALASAVTEACARASRFAFATSPLESALRMRLVSGTERRAQHSPAAHQKEGPDRGSKTRTGDGQAAFPCHCSDALAMREKS